MMGEFPVQADIVFNAKPDAIPYNYRISYKVSQLCLILHICGWGNSCSLIKVHMISYPHRPERLRFQTLSFPRWNHSETKCGIPPSSPRAFARVFPGRSSFQRQPGNSISSMRPQLSPQSPRSSLWIDTASRHLPSICVLCF